MPDIGTSFKADAIQALLDLLRGYYPTLWWVLRLRHVLAFDKLAYSISFNKQLSDSVHLPV